MGIPEPGFNAECPVCGDPVVAFPVTMPGRVFGPMSSPRTREELIAACRTHGHPPFNDRTLVALGLKEARPDRATPSERRALGAVFAIYAGVVLVALVAVLLVRG